jgi:hypothetical protein
MAGLLDYPELPGLLPMPSWDDVARSTPSGMDSARFWHLPGAMPQAADAAPAPMMDLSDPSQPLFAPPQSSFAGPPAVNWALNLPPVAPPVPPGNSGAVFGIYPPVRRRRPARPDAAAPHEPPAAAPPAAEPAAPSPDAAINEQQLAREAFDAAARRTRRPMIAPSAPPRQPSRLVPLVRAALEPGSRYWQTYNTMRRDAQDQMGVDQMDAAVRGRAADGTFTRGLLNTAMGGLNFTASPINAGLRTVFGEPLERLTGGWLPKELTEFGAALFIPIPKTIPLPTGRVIKVRPQLEDNKARLGIASTNLRNNFLSPLTEASEPPSMGDWHVP